MIAQLERVMRFVTIVQGRKRVTVESLREELEVSQSAVYRMISAAQMVMPLRLEQGVVIYGGPAIEKSSN